MAHIFISYSHKDDEFVHGLYDALCERGFDCWIDSRIDYGTKWPQEIKKQLEGCEAFILVMSPDAEESEWVQDELAYARHLKKTIFPLLFRGNVWWSLARTQFVDLREGILPKEDFYTRLEVAAPGSFHPQQATVDTGDASHTEKTRPAKVEFAQIYLDYLREQGFRPETDKDGDVVFKVEGKTYLIIVDEDDLNYFRLVFPNFWEIESDEEHQKVLAAVDQASSKTKVAKVYTTPQNNVWASVEIFLPKPESFAPIFERSLNALQACVASFVEQMR